MTAIPQKHASVVFASSFCYFRRERSELVPLRDSSDDKKVKKDEQNQLRKSSDDKK